MKKNSFIRHGDMFFVRVSGSETKGKKSQKLKNLVVGEGEINGHLHVVSGVGNAQIIGFTTEEKVITPNDDLILFEVKGGAALITHEEHAPIILEEGVYTRINQVEYNPFEAQLAKVRD